MCWDGTDTVAPSFSVTQSFSEVWPSWELPTVLSLVYSHFSNSSFLQGNRKGSLGPGRRYPKLCDCENLWVPAGHEAMLFGKWQRLQRKTTEQPTLPQPSRKPAEKLRFPPSCRSWGEARTPPCFHPGFAECQAGPGPTLPTRVPAPAAMLPALIPARRGVAQCWDHGHHSSAPTHVLLRKTCRQKPRVKRSHWTRVGFGRAVPQLGGLWLSGSHLGLVPEEKCFPHKLQ